MKQDTILTNDLESLDGEKMYDQTCKQILANKIILAWILKKCVSEHKDTKVEEIAYKHIEGTPEVSAVKVHTGDRIIGTSTESSSKNEGRITFDIRCRATAPSNDELIVLLINLEAHNDQYPGYPIIKRGVYHGCRMISHQYGTDFTKVDYNKIKKVYSIWLLRNVPKKRENSISSYSMAETHHIGHVELPKEHYDLITVTMIYLGDDPEDKQSSELLNMLNLLFSEKVTASEKIKILEKDFQIPATENFINEVEQMCNFSQGVKYTGYKEGREHGIEEGVLKTIVNMVKNLKLSPYNAIIAAGIPEDKRESYAFMIKEYNQ